MTTSRSDLPMTPAAISGPFGYFVGQVTASWIDGRPMVLAEDFAYIDHRGRRWDAPRGSHIDGASIPRVFWSVIGGPYEGRYRYASVIHDVYCQLGRSGDPGARKWQDTHKMFYGAMRASSVPNLKALVMFAAVYKFGPTWDNPVGFLQRIWSRIWRFLGPLPSARREPMQAPDVLDYRDLEEMIVRMNLETPEDVMEQIQR